MKKAILILVSCLFLLVTGCKKEEITTSKELYWKPDYQICYAINGPASIIDTLFYRIYVEGNNTTHFAIDTFKIINHDTITEQINTLQGIEYYNKLLFLGYADSNDTLYIRHNIPYNATIYYRSDYDNFYSPWIKLTTSETGNAIGILQ